MKFRDLQNNSIDFEFFFNGENFVYVLLFVLYQRRYHAVKDFEKNFLELFWTQKNFPRLLMTLEYF